MPKLLILSMTLFLCPCALYAQRGNLPAAKVDNQLAFYA